MLELLSLFFAPPLTLSSEQIIAQTPIIRPLNGELNQIPVFNSNSPELVLAEGILLSTFPQEGKKHPSAHLPYTFEGRFDIFAHHVAKAVTPDDTRTLYLGVIAHNPSDKPVNLNILTGATYLSQPDAPFVKLPPQIESRTAFAGPGSRVMGDILQRKRQDIFPPLLTIPPQSSRMILSLPIPVQNLEPKLNGRSSYVQINSDGKVHLASLAMYGEGEDNPPSLSQWEELLRNGNISSPRDRAPSAPNSGGNIIYGRVAGVAIGNEWKADLLDSPDSRILTIPKADQKFVYPLSSLVGGTFGTGQIQTAPLDVRYDDTAYSAHGNYGVKYNLTLPLSNPHNTPKTVKINISTPLKTDAPTIEYGEFNQVFFRGMVQVKYNDEQNIPRWRYFHLVQTRGQQGEDLLTLTLPPESNRLVSVEFLYPPDATPPQVLTITTNPS
ncbi:MAG: DUF3370 domain-containing protein [Cyanobacterium sp. T60_A2020_053]|nr:DUF3370 domain-containing protein [Cyanobacterium sp. T60_A2020_053]